MFRKISTKIILSFIIIFVLVLSLVGLVIDKYTVDLVKKNIYSYFQSSNRARAEHIRTFVQDQKKTSVILAAASVYRDFLKEPETSSQYLVIKNKIDKRLVRTIEADTNIYEAFIIDAKGKIVASSQLANEGMDKSNDEYFIKAKNDVFIKDVYFSETIKQLNYTISSPIKDEDGTFLGVSVLRYLPEHFFSIVKSENGLGKTEENFLINREKFFLTPSIFLGDSVILKQKVETENASNCFNPKEEAYIEKNGYSNLTKVFGSQIVEANDYRNVAVIATHAYIPETGWCLITKADKSELFAFQPTIIIIFLIIFIVSIFIFALIGFIVSKKIANPIKSLMEGIKNVKKGNFDYSVKVGSSDEVEMLSDEFNKMVSVVKQSRSEIEKKVKEQTEELKKAKDEIESKFKESDKFNKLVVDREIKMVELKNKISKLEKEVSEKNKKEIE